MNQFLKKFPLPIAGLMLGLAAAGNLVQSYGEVYRNMLGTISAILLIIMVVKILTDQDGFKDNLDNPVVASVFPTFSMAIMLFSTYLKPFAPSLAFRVWIIGVSLHIILIIWFTKKYTLHFKIKQTFPSWFVVYVGIVVASVTGPVYKMATLGQYAFWFGFATYLILLPIVSYRVLKIKEMPEPTMPTLAIYAAPASLLLAGYMNSFETKNMAIVWFLMMLSIIMYVLVIIMLSKLLKLKFYPSYSSFTFPLVISGIAMKLTNGFLIKTNQAIPSLQYLIKFQEIVGVLMTLYVLYKYYKFFTIKDTQTLKKS